MLKNKLKQILADAEKYCKKGDYFAAFKLYKEYQSYFDSIAKDAVMTAEEVEIGKLSAKIGILYCKLSTRTIDLNDAFLECFFSYSLNNNDLIDKIPVCMQGFFTTCREISKSHLSDHVAYQCDYVNNIYNASDIGTQNQTDEQISIAEMLEVKDDYPHKIEKLIQATHILDALDSYIEYYRKDIKDSDTYLTEIAALRAVIYEQIADLYMDRFEKHKDQIDLADKRDYLKAAEKYYQAAIKIAECDAEDAKKTIFLHTSLINVWHNLALCTSEDCYVKQMTDYLKEKNIPDLAVNLADKDRKDEVLNDIAIFNEFIRSKDNKLPISKRRKKLVIIDNHPEETQTLFKLQEDINEIKVTHTYDKKYNPNDAKDIKRLEEETKHSFKYVHSEHGPTKINASIQQISALEGQYGLFATKGIKSGTLIGYYEGVVSKPSGEYNSSAYIFSSLDKEGNVIEVNALKERTYTAFMNHSFVPNVIAKQIKINDEYKIAFYAIRDIKKGEQMLYHYGPGFFGEGFVPYYLQTHDNQCTPREQYLSNKDDYADDLYAFNDKACKDLQLNTKKWLIPKSFMAIRNNDVKTLKKSLEKATTPDLPIIAYDAIDEIDKQQFVTPLMFACYLGHEKCIEALLDGWQADANRTTLISGDTALSFLLKGQGDEAVIERMALKLLGGSSEDHTYMPYPFIPDLQNQHIFHYAILRNSLAIVKEILNIADQMEYDLFTEMYNENKKPFPMVNLDSTLVKSQYEMLELLLKKINPDFLIKLINEQKVFTTITLKSLKDAGQLEKFKEFLQKHFIHLLQNTTCQLRNRIDTLLNRNNDVSDDNIKNENENEKGNKHKRKQPDQTVCKPSSRKRTTTDELRPHVVNADASASNQRQSSPSKGDNDSAKQAKSNFFARNLRAKKMQHNYADLDRVGKTNPISNKL